MSPGSRLSAFLRALALLILLVVVLEGLYAAGGHGIVAAAWASHQRTFLKNLISTEGPHSLTEYLAAADAWFAVLRLWVLVVGGVLALGTLAGPLTAAIYGRMEAVAGRWARQPVLFLVAAGVISLLLTAAVALFVLEDFPNSGDEYCYLYQAQTFALGRLGNPPHPLQEFFELLHVGERNGRLVTSFPPGWPALLTGGVVLHLPLWIFNPLIGAASLVVLFLLARMIYDGRTAVVAVVTMLVSSFFLFTSASYFAHALAALLLLLFVHFALRAIDGNRIADGTIAGACLGWAVVTRYYPALLCAAAVVPFAFGKRPRPYRALGSMVAGGLPFLLLLIAYNAATMGHPLLLTRGGLEAEGRWFPSNVIGRGAELLLSRLGRLVMWAPPVLIVAYLAFLREGMRDVRQRVVVLVFPCLVVGLIPFVDSGGNQYGPRYYYEGFPFLVMAAVGGLFSGSYVTKSPRQQALVYLFAVSLLAAVPLLAYHARVEHRVVLERTNLYRQVETQQVNNAVVIIQSRVGGERSMSPLDLTRNGPDIAGSVLYAVDRGEDNRRLMDYYPTRSYYTYRYDAISRRGILMRVAAPAVR